MTSSIKYKLNFPLLGNSLFIYLLAERQSLSAFSVRRTLAAFCLAGCAPAQKHAVLRQEKVEVSISLGASHTLAVHKISINCESFVINADFLLLKFYVLKLFT